MKGHNTLNSYRIVKGCCPKCDGGDIVIYQIEGVFYQAKCLDCNHTGLITTSSEEAISYWNKGTFRAEMSLSEFIDRFGSNN